MLFTYDDHLLCVSADTLLLSLDLASDDDEQRAWQWVDEESE